MPAVNGPGIPVRGLKRLTKFGVKRKTTDGATGEEQDASIFSLYAKVVRICANQNKPWAG